MTLSRRHNYEAWLVPYAEGTLDPARAALLEARLARDPALAAQADMVRTVTAHLHQAAQNGPGSDPRLSFHHVSVWPDVQKCLSPPLSPAPQRRLWAGSACAAALVLGALLLYSSLLGIRARHVPTLPVHVAQRDITPTPRAETPVPARHKKGGRRTHSRPQPFALHLSKHPSALLAARPALPSPAPDTSETPLPTPALPAAHAAVALEEGSAHFRLASPVGSSEETDSAQDKTLPPNTDNPQAAPAPASSPQKTVQPARTARRHQSRRRARAVPVPTIDTPAAPPPAKIPAASRVL